MSTRTEICVAIVCNGCGRECQHFADAESARAYVTDEGKARGELWQVGDKDLCGRCVTRNACRAHGHDWSDWRARSQIEGLESRFCWRCDQGVEHRRHRSSVEVPTRVAVCGCVRTRERPWERLRLCRRHREGWPL
jgi:hypothetical protein